MKKKRQSTVEPVIGSLTSFYGLRKINTLGISQANKVMLLSATACNLKKLLKFSEKRFRKVAQTAESFVFSQIDPIQTILSLIRLLKEFRLIFVFQ